MGAGGVLGKLGEVQWPQHPAKGVSSSQDRQEGLEMLNSTCSSSAFPKLEPLLLKPVSNFLADCSECSIEQCKGRINLTAQEKGMKENKCRSPVSSPATRAHCSQFQNKGIINYSSSKTTTKVHISQRGGVIYLLCLACKMRNKEWKAFAKLLR